ncbi:MAG: DHH family phosphoesterase [Anaerolineae bacterium]
MADGLSAAIAGAAAELLEARRVWIGTHVDPDGDAIGSALGLGTILRDMGKRVVTACDDPPPPETAFLPGVKRMVRTAPTNEDIWSALDAADESRLGTLYDPERWAAARTHVVDHHASNAGFGDVNVIDPSAASTAEIVVALADAMGVTPSSDAATCLLTGVVTDTLGFRTSNTTPRTLECARRLMSWGADLGAINQHVFYRRPMSALRLIGRAIERTETHGPFAISTISRADLRELGAAPGAMRGVTAILATAAEPDAFALLRERADGSVDISLRSKPGVDLIPAAVALGGGGHPQASGAKIDGPLDAARERVLAALQAHVAPLADRQAGIAPDAGGAQAADPAADPGADSGDVSGTAFGDASGTASGDASGTASGAASGAAGADGAAR